MYIVLEGIDGVGKSSQIELLEKWFIDNNYIVEKVVEPTDSDIGKLIRQQLQMSESTTDTNQQMLALLFAADRLTLKNKINSLPDNNVIISDRSFYSSICYQNNSSIETKWIYDVNCYTPKPDLTILLDLDVDEAIKRCDKEEVFENTDFLIKTRENYLKLLDDHENIELVDASGSITDVHNKIIKIVKERIL